MPTKQEIIQKLKNVKLVIGNGFDLHCHLKTSYSDFFNSRQKLNEYLNNWFSKSTELFRDYIKLIQKKQNNPQMQKRLFENFTGINMWDLYFYLISREQGVEINKWLWCDIESKIQISLSDDAKDSILWISVHNLMKGLSNDFSSNEVNALACLAFYKHENKPFNAKKTFFSFLLSELKEFEKAFGNYIRKQHFSTYYPSYGVYEANTLFSRCAQKTITDLCNIENLISIDSFNFGSIDTRQLESILYNINGDTESPIFGIDSDTFKSDDPRYIFSKTNRRMEIDMLNEMVEEKAPFDNVIVYGHSLNAADYSYFFSLLDKLDITNFDDNSKIIFAFTVYNSKKEYEIKSGLRKAIIKLFEDYSTYKGKEKYPNKLLDALTTQSKVLMLEIPEIDMRGNHLVQ